MATEAEIESWKTDPDAAYAEAERLIEEARRNDALEVDFSSLGTSLPALRTLPPSIASLSNLHEIDFRNTQITDLTPIARIKTLKRINVNATKVDDLTPLTALYDLTNLFVSNCPVTDLSPLTALTSLETIDLSNSLVTDLTPIHNLPNLVGGADISDAHGLSFKNTAATLSDENLLGLSELKNPDRTTLTLQYLQSQRLGGPGTSNSADDPSESGNIGHNSLARLLERPPARVVKRNRTIDLDPAGNDDEPENSSDFQLANLPKRQRNLAQQVMAALGQNQRTTSVALSQYAHEIAPTGVVLEILKDAIAVADVGMEQAIRENAVDDDTIKAWNTFQKNNVIFFTHYPLDTARDALYRSAPINLTNVDTAAIAEAFAAFTNTLKDEEVAPAVGERLFNWATVSESLAYQIRDEALRRDATEGNDTPDIGFEYDLPLEKPVKAFQATIKRTIAQGWIVATKIGEFFETTDGKSIKNIVWFAERIVAAAAALAFALFRFFT